jgi:hypothetical protein
MPWNAELAATYVRIHALGHSSGNCAHFVRVAVAAGGINLAITHFAKDYGNNLLLAGFQVVATNPLLAGDVVVIQPIPGHPAGHMALYDGSVWISDFKQYHGFYPGPAYRQIKPP